MDYRIKYDGRTHSYTISIDDCNTSLGKDAMNRVSTNGLFVAFFFKLVLIFLPLRSLRPLRFVSQPPQNQ
ncbi:hypothetical protein [Nostoc sp.]|uniref:hypothetical protein n=1 Tax=Nostoc sp. TaxID=1180 RepID=UPI002FF60BC1